MNRWSNVISYKFDCLLPALVVNMTHTCRSIRFKTDNLFFDLIILAILSELDQDRRNRRNKFMTFVFFNKWLLIYVVFFVKVCLSFSFHIHSVLQSVFVAVLIEPLFDWHGHHSFTIFISFRKFAFVLGMAVALWIIKLHAAKLYESYSIVMPVCVGFL